MRNNIKTYNKIARAVRDHGHITVVFESQYGYIRKRKIFSDGRCFVSHQGLVSLRWDRYSVSCFIFKKKDKTLKKTIDTMYYHDNETDVWPIEMWINGEVEELCSGL